VLRRKGKGSGFGAKINSVGREEMEQIQDVLWVLKVGIVIEHSTQMRRKKKNRKRNFLAEKKNMGQEHWSM